MDRAHAWSLGARDFSLHAAERSPKNKADSVSLVEPGTGTEYKKGETLCATTELEQYRV